MSSRGKFNHKHKKRAKRNYFQTITRTSAPSSRFILESALLRTSLSILVCLTAEGASQSFESGFGRQLAGRARGQGRTHRVFQAAEAGFHRPAPTVTFAFEVILIHPAPPEPAPAAIRTLSGRFDRAFHPPFQPALVMHPLRVITRIRIQFRQQGGCTGLGHQFASRTGRTTLTMRASHIIKARGTLGFLNVYMFVTENFPHLTKMRS